MTESQDSSAKISRREFLKLASLGAIASFIPERLESKIDLTSKPLKTAEKNPIPESDKALKEAFKLPSIEYHDPYFKAAGKRIMTPEVFQSQLDWLKTSDCYTPTAQEVAGYLKGEKSLPFNSVVLRFDLGTDKINPETQKSVWLEIFKELKERNLHALVFLIPTTIGSLTEKGGLTWSDITDYIKSGTISVCSHGLADHPDYRHISTDYALSSMLDSKEKITQSLKEAGINNYPVLGFAFPFDSVPENALNLVKTAGYKFFAGGIAAKIGQNAALFGKEETGLPCFYPYIHTDELTIRKEQAQNNFALIPISGNLSFPDVLAANQNDIIFNQEWPKYQLELAALKPLAEEKIFTGRLIPASVIIIHTDSQNPKEPTVWKAENTFNGINGQNRKVAVHFGADQNHSLQFIPLYFRQNKIWLPEPKEENEGAKGIGSAINIEMSGGNFDQYLKENPNHPVILSTLTQTATLVTKIIKTSGGTLDENKIFGHYEMTARGKSDPGEKTMSILREMIAKTLNSSKQLKNQTY